MIRKIIFVAISILLAIAHFKYGTSITLFLSVTIIASWAYYLVQLANEKSIELVMIKHDSSDEGLKPFLRVLKNKRALFLSSVLLIIVFLMSILCLKSVMNPTGKHTWFQNVDHYAIRNTAIGFDQKAEFNTKAIDDSMPSKLIFFNGNNKANIETQNFYKPILQEVANGKYQLVNHAFSKSAEKSIQINLDNYILKIEFEQRLKRVWYKPWKTISYTDYKVAIDCSDLERLAELGLGNEYRDEFEFSLKQLKIGLSLNSILLENIQEVDIKSATQLLLQDILAEIGDSYLLANDADQFRYDFFPNSNFDRLNYSCLVDGNTLSSSSSVRCKVELKKPFYIGLGNQNEQLVLDTANGQAVIKFDFPQSFYLSNPEPLKSGTKCERFITNQIKNLVHNHTTAGFYFSNATLNSSEKIDGVIDYVSDKPNCFLAANFIDKNNLSKGTQQIVNNSFNLVSNSGSLKFYFDFRDFSENGFSYNKSLFYASFLFLLFVALLLFKRGDKLERIEPIIWAIIYSLLIIRFILYWRLATFPPLENISKFELENTLIGFDFSLLGMKLPFPSTLLFSFLIVVSIWIYRLGYFSKNDFYNFVAQKLIRFHLDRTGMIIFQYALFIMVCLVVNFFVNIDFLKRIVTILIPLIAYSFVSVKMNEVYVTPKLVINKEAHSLFNYGKSFFYYIIHNPTFYLTIISLLFFAIVDRGFCILFFLFILLKNVLLNFLKKSISDSNINLRDMFFKPWNFWIYGLLSLIIYLIVLSFKSLFYYILTYKLFVIGAVMVLITSLLFVFFKHRRKLLLWSFAFTILYFLLLIIPTTNHFLDNKISQQLKFVQHRASIIHQPISQLLKKNAYSSFNTQKIIEIAENQWFINSYISQKFDATSPINLRKFSKVGVNYNTQTRDVVVARFIIAELGGFCMALLLGLFITPLLIYLLSYKLIQVENKGIFQSETYGGLIPLIFLFTISLFVWLTSTNRFVFFGQDFPFLSLTSRLSVLMPLLLFALVLIRKPIAYNSLTLNLQKGVARYLLLMFGIILFGFTTFKSNELSENNFSVVVKPTQTKIDIQFNAILYSIQDSLEERHIKFNYDQLCKLVISDKRYQLFKSSEVNDVYTNSILDKWELNPSSAMQINNPLYIRYDQGRYISEYNKNLYLALPITDNKKVWHGKIMEQESKGNEQIILSYNGKTASHILPFVINDVPSNIQFAMMPQSWQVNSIGAKGLINVTNQYKASSKILISKSVSQSKTQSTTTFINSFEMNDIAYVKAPNKTYEIYFHGNQHEFVNHKWVNNEYRSIFPQGENNFWLHHFSNTLKGVYQNSPNENVGITIDYRLFEQVQQNINSTYKSISKKNKGFNFSVIVADGDGNIRLMNDFVRNRKVLDPNDKSSIYNLHKQHFFYSNSKNERDQWGNTNLLNLHLGPGSSIKPLITASMASQVNAGWEDLKFVHEVVKDADSYGGLKLSNVWKHDEHYGLMEVGMSDYIKLSSNYFHSLIMFLGSYRKSSFGVSDYSLKNILTRKHGANNEFPKLKWNDSIYYLPNFNKCKGNWPFSDASKTISSYFANENSILATGLSINLNLATLDNDKKDGSPMNTRKTFFVDTNIENRMRLHHSIQSLWSLPEASSFSQKMRHLISNKKKNEMQENFNLGLKTATLGGYPFQITPFKMLEMYNSLFTFNKNYEMHISSKLITNAPWTVDSSWTMSQFRLFLCKNIFEGMKGVIYEEGGTAPKLRAVANKFPNQHFYAKTGTINEEGSVALRSRRLIVTVTNQDMTDVKKLQLNDSPKVYSFYFVVDNNHDFDWGLLNSIIENTLLSNKCKNYFN